LELREYQEHLMRITATRHVAQKFARALNRGLFRYYGRNPSAAMVARDFNLRSRSESPISQEAARKWMRGLTVPELAKMQVLAEWLNLDLRALDGNEEPAADSAGLMHRGTTPSLDSVSDANLRERLNTIVAELDRAQCEVVLNVMLGLVRLSATNGRPRVALRPAVEGAAAMVRETLAAEGAGQIAGRSVVA
jgi:hypothetical protein